MGTKVEQHKEIIDSNNKLYNEMKTQKDELQNERRSVDTSVYDTCNP